MAHKLDKNGRQEYWDRIYSKRPEKQLGWFETDLSPTINLINQTGLPKSSRILNVGAGNTRLVDFLIQEGYTKLLATDISKVALNQLALRLPDADVEYIVDDLCNATSLLKIQPVDLWIDRAVLHFFLEKKDQMSYVELIHNKVKQNGFVLLAQFHPRGADKCSGLALKRYDYQQMHNLLGKGFELKEHFLYTYTMPSGELRPYQYALFRKT
jgi:ubiquinone/menaquinone biosynthesis C-methylase UbiE